MRYLFLSVFLGVAASAQVPEPPSIEHCGTGVDKAAAELRAVECPEGFVGQWFQTRPPNSCEWVPKEPQWFACSQIIDPVGGPPHPLEVTP